MTTQFIFVMVNFGVTGCSNSRFFKHSSAPYQHSSLDCAIRAVYHSNIHKPLTTKTWYIGGVYKMRQEFGIIWVEYREPSIDMLTHPLHTKIG